ncbi:MAG: T9SS type A sorting domain-containing protein [Saprospiraceae bacterium]
MKPLISLLLLLFLAATTGFSQNRYVARNSPGASDGNPGTEAQPWLTIQHAANSATPGTTVFIKQGTYFESVYINVSGTPGQYITFTNFGSDQVIIDGSNTIGSQTILVGIYQQSYIKVNGLKLQNAIGNFSAGFYIGLGSDFIEVTDNLVENIHFDNNPNALVNSVTNVNPFVVYNTAGNNSCSNILVANNEIRNCRTGFSEALTLSGNVENFTVANNVVHDITNIGIDIAGGYGVSTNPATDMARNGTVRNNVTYNCVSAYAVSAGIYVDGGHNVVIEQNTSYGNGRGYEVGCEQLGHTATGIIVRNNLSFNNLEAGIGIGGYNFTGGETGKVTDSQVQNNTFYNNNTSGIYNGELLVEYTENCVIENNIFHGLNTQNLLVVTRENSTGLTVDYNLYYSPAGAAAAVVDYEGNVYTGWSTYRQYTGLDANSTFAAAGFLDAGNQNFDLANNSPARDAGNPAFAPAAGETDFNGANRLVGGRVDAGAYEIQSPLPVDFTSFTARREKTTVELHWTTGSESANDRFEVERSADGITFNSIGSVAAANRAADYRFTDERPLPAVAYYRLHQIDFDGTATYSTIATVGIAPRSFTVYPNPFTDFITIELPGTASLDLEVVDLRGSVVLLTKAVNGEPVDLRGLKSGTYLLRVAGSEEAIKVVKR